MKHEDKRNNKPRGVRYSEYEKYKAIELAKKVGTLQAGKELNIRPESIIRWVKQEYGKPFGQHTDPYSEETRKKTIELALKIGIREASIQTNISAYTITKWIKNDEDAYYKALEAKIIPTIKKYTNEEKEKAIQDAIDKGIKASSKENGIGTTAIRNWAIDLGLYERMSINPRYSKEALEKAIKMVKVDKHKIKYAAKCSGVSAWALAYWIKYQDRLLEGNITDYASKEEVIKYAEEHNTTEASKYYNIPYTTIRSWMKKYKETKVNENKEK